MSWKRTIALIVAPFAVACSGATDSPPPVADEPSAPAAPDQEEEVEEPPVAPPSAACVYTNPFSQGPECREYVGPWAADQVATDCAAQQGVEQDSPCDAGQIGTCLQPVEADRLVRVFAYGDESGCQITSYACRAFADGTWEPTTVCEDTGDDGPIAQTVFQPPVKVCKDPMPGEAPGAGPNGQVCTWQLISGATEEGRKFVDYASCDVVRTQRPYYAYRRPDDAERDDPRMDDPEYVTELNWVKSQIEATACVCCHQSSITPDGVSNWDIDQAGNFMNGFYATGLALGANWIDSTALGAFPPEENNGFERETSGFPSTDPARMKAFFEGELDYRGLTPADFETAPPFGGPLYDQIYYEPTACPAGVGVSDDGTVRWEGGDARYVYLLEVGSLSPTIPPNLDTPLGTVWRLDVAPDAEPLESGSLKVGDVPRGAAQVVPDAGAPQLEAGRPYYLYVSADVGVPITRCITR